MRHFFNPSSMAVVGASKHKIGHQIIQNLLYGYKGVVYLVNPHYSEIDGTPCFSSIEEIPNPVDLAIVLVPAPAVPGILEACGRKGVLRVMILSAGFAEVGDQGREIQDRCTAIAKKAGIRIWGPNCMGMVDVPGKHFFTFMRPSIYEDGLIPGRISLVVQSGMLSGAFLAEMGRRTIGIGKVCSIGNKSDVDECDILEYLLGDADTDVVAFYLESIPRGRLFAELAGRSTKPIVVLKGGKSEAGARAALSHTSSLSGNFRLLESVLKMSGVTLANDFNQMIDLARALAMMRESTSQGRTAVLTFSGGAGILTCDLLERYQLKVARLTEKTLACLSRIFPSWMPAANPVDLFPTMELRGRAAAYHGAIACVLEDPDVDVLLIHHVAGLDDDVIDLAALKNKAAGAGKSMMFWLVGRQEASRLFRHEAQANGIPVYEEISRTVECLSAVARFRPRKRFGRGVEGSSLPLPAVDLKEFFSYAAGERIWDEHDSKRLLARGGIPVVEEKLVSSLAEAKEVARDMGFPVVLKGLLPGVVHKTELDLIHMGISGRSDLEDAYLKISERMGERGRILVQRQVKIDFELMAGFLRDDQFGPCVMFGLGGTLSELQPDVVFALAPLERTEALELVTQIRGKRLLEGFRGMAPLKKEEMADLLVNLGRLGDAYPQIDQIDMNPVVVRRGSPMAIDATIILKTMRSGQEYRNER